jgi:hypothetical protein
MYYKLNIDKKNLNMSLLDLYHEYDRVYKLASARTKAFGDNYDNYYWSRLTDLNIIIELKKGREFNNLD